jgi:hypothetical protein
MNNKKTNLRFTKLTTNDKIEHEGWYIELLTVNSVDNYKILTSQQRSLLRDYYIKELQRATALFLKEFG